MSLFQGEAGAAVKDAASGAAQKTGETGGSVSEIAIGNRDVYF